MNDKINDKLDIVIQSINNDQRFIRLKELQEKILNEKYLVDLREKLIIEQENPYSDSYRTKKIEYTSNPLINEYLKLENEVYFLVLNINQTLKKLIDEKRCHNENN